jgi:hypothetical protein
MSCQYWLTDWPAGLPTEEARRLVGDLPPARPGGRVVLYVCPECGDLGCGAVTAVVESADGEVVWRDFGWQNDYEPGVDLDMFKGVGPFHFEASQYEAQLRGVL